MKVLAISGSTRSESFNTTLTKLAQNILTGHQVALESGLAHIPFYNADVEAISIPEPVAALRNRVRDNNLTIIATPEYNGTTPGVLMNAIEWLSRPHRNSALDARKVLIFSASPTPGGGRRSAEHLRAVLQRSGADVLPLNFNVAKAHSILEPGSPALENATQELHAVLHQALRLAEAYENALQ